MSHSGSNVLISLQLSEKLTLLKDLQNLHQTAFPNLFPTFTQHPYKRRLLACGFVSILTIFQIWPLCSTWSSYFLFFFASLLANFQMWLLLWLLPKSHLRAVPLKPYCPLCWKILYFIIILAYLNCLLIPTYQISFHF